MLKNYTAGRAAKMEKFSSVNVTEPFNVKILWMRALNSEKAVLKTTLKNHRHSFFEAHYIFSGEIIYSSGGNEYSVTAGKAIVFAPDCLHAAKYTSPDALKISIAFFAEADEKAFDFIADTGNYYFEFDTTVKNDFDALLLAADKTSNFISIMFKNRITEILCSLVCDLGESFIENSFVSEDVRITAAKRYIEDNKHLFFTCNDIADYCHFNVKYFNRIFKANTGITLLEYIHDVKRKEAERLLLSSSASLSEIAESLGFENECYFNTFFKRLCGITPGEYRRLCNKK